ncbi:hypothetical protein [Clostridium butyricum]|uniref:hypothetical protein n=1 Tax=Clostridium butyricum TaxID=1492 RepID=UPI0005C15AED|nr:hypothetical protein [Clostridium butyricum]KIU07788.1 hypothetical protein SC08_Contig83orf01710 [Clostridium butyricum]MBA8967619.1 hypothetical protein [Clostridium butyricum]MBA8971314.1 hypothetical protein [Clostridium butyricum]MBC2429376.1 hypothetical protein [Clostridium butyricum]NOW36820.1 hypothetical protein [Clostridium butyricum]
MAKNKISISFSKSKQNIYEYLKTKDNISNYICNLVEKDMHSSNADNDLESRIEIILQRLLIRDGLTLSIPQPTSSNAEDQDVVSLINELF